LSDTVSAAPLAWLALLALLTAMILVDLRVGAGKRHMDVRTAAVWSAIWIAVSVLFGAGLWAVSGGEAGESYFAGYVMEKALSLDNVFVFTLIFGALAVPRDEQPRVLLYGILIALVLRAAFIFAGAEALEAYSWVAYPFAALLAWTGWRILRSGEEHDEGAKFVDRVRRRWPGLKPSVAALLAVALADVVFAVDSVPAILAITTDTFVVFSANAFALLGLRALFFLVAGAVARFAYLQLGLGVLLIGIAGKLVYGELTGDKVPTLITLGAIVAIVGAAIAASVLRPPATPPAPPAAPVAPPAARSTAAAGRTRRGG
jgi:tellurite resistance protein TerC